MGILRAKHTHDPGTGAKLTTWLFIKAHGALLDGCRTQLYVNRWAYARGLRVFTFDAAQAAYEGDRESELEGNDPILRQALRGALDTLDPGERELVYRVAVLGESVTEAAPRAGLNGKWQSPARGAHYQKLLGRLRLALRGRRHE